MSKSRELDAAELAIGASEDPDTQPLLQGDSNEELRQADRVHEKKEHAKEGKSKRIAGEELQESIDAATYDKLLKTDGAGELGLPPVSPGRASQRRASKKGAAAASPASVRGALRGGVAGAVGAEAGAARRVGELYHGEQAKHPGPQHRAGARALLR